MKKYLIILLLMVIGCENQLHAMFGDYEIAQDNIRILRRLAEMFHQRLIFDFGGIPEREMQKMRNTTARILKKQLKRREEQLEQVMQRLLQQQWQEVRRQQAEPQQRPQQRWQEWRRQEFILEGRAEAQAIKHQKKTYSKYHCAQTRTNQHNAPIHQPRSNNYAIKNKR